MRVFFFFLLLMNTFNLYAKEESKFKVTADCKKNSVILQGDFTKYKPLNCMNNQKNISTGECNEIKFIFLGKLRDRDRKNVVEGTQYSITTNLGGVLNGSLDSPYEEVVKNFIEKCPEIMKYEEPQIILNSNSNSPGSSIVDQHIMDLKDKLNLNEENKLKKILLDNNLTVIYQNGKFVVAKSNKNQIFFIKEGLIKKNNEVKEEVVIYNEYLIKQQDAERINLANQQEQARINLVYQQEQARIKEQNRSYRWIVQAQAVCSGGYRCSIKSITHNGWNEYDGSAMFSISYESWTLRGSSGSSGVASIECGFNKSNTLRSTSVNAVCQ